MSGMGIYGLSGSGIDVDSMVRMGMMNKQNEYDKMYKKEVRNEWTKEAYANMYSDLNKFNSVTMSSYRMSSTSNPQTVSSTNSSVVTATANADAAQMSHTVKVNSLASNAYLLTGSEGITRSGGSAGNKSIYLEDVLGAGALNNPGEAITMEVSDGDKTATLKLTYEQIYTNHQTLNDLASAFKKLKDDDGETLNLSASYDATNDAFTLYNKSSGSENKISIKPLNPAAEKLMDNLKLHEVDGGSMSEQAVDFTENTAKEVAGKDASVTIDGRIYDKLSNNKITVSNVTYSFQSVSAAGSTATLTVTQDTDKIIENVKKFVEDYNKMLDALNDKYYEEKYKDYDVLTQNQEKAMTKEQIDKWNEKAKSGLLNHNQTIGKMISQMREAIYTPVESVDSNYNTMMSIGVSSSTDRGHLTLDEEKLKKALAADPDCVYQLLTSSGEKVDKNGKSYTDYNSEGVAQRIGDKVMDVLKEMKDYAGTSTEDDGSTLGNLIRDMKTKMSNFKVMMSAYESLLYKKYDAMETAIQRLAYQSGYITGQ
ncbi:flagellar filament capping protein FliD [Selenomonas ruminantium]|uniref:flagellar filament capping protein FliD n=1 Tax=Selenomonas ruminantium TaxID=971 RepID=UPI000400CC68|nr:flagellar filament capping protein FliD [Selenomonas ruminantium]